MNAAYASLAGSLTIILQVAALLPRNTVIFVLPVFFPVTTPLDDTVAILLLALFQENGPESPLDVADSLTLFPT